MALRFPSLAVAALIALAMAACRSEPTNEQEAGDPAANFANLMPIPATDPTLDRAALIEAVEAAASSFSIGADDGDLQRSLAGRRFAFRMVFGCPGQAKDTTPSDMRLTVREGGRSYEVRATFSLDAAAAGFESIQAANNAATSDSLTPAVEAVEGFWIQHPWIKTEACPRPIEPSPSLESGARDAVIAGKGTADDAEDMQGEVERSIGLARFFTSNDSRVGARAGRDYVKVVALDNGQLPPPGIFLFVEGRLRAWPDGKVIECHEPRRTGHPVASRPSCVVGVNIDRVAFERADDRSIIAEWSN
jgi:hypothetical protein